jgi:K+-sensing histidine kinase KdpD
VTGGPRHRRANDHLEVRVVDTGQGISPEFLPHVFERFRQADSATALRTRPRARHRSAPC